MIYFEPVNIEGYRQLAKIDSDLGTITYFEIKDLKGDELALVTNLFWLLPDKLHPEYDYEGIPYQMETGDWKDRFIRVCQRIMWFLDETMYFVDNKHQAIITNFIMNSYFKEVFEFAPRIIIGGTTSSGKTRLLNILESLSYRGKLVPDISPPAVFRWIESFNITTILDEIQDYSKEYRNGFNQILKNGVSRRGNVVRNELNNFNQWYPKEFNIYGPLVIVNKSGAYIPEDVENRSFNIRMVENRSKKLPTIVDERDMVDIRTEMHTLRAMWLMFPEHIDLKTLFEETIIELDSERELDDGIGIIRNRSKDIASTYYTLSKLSGTERTILELLSESQKENLQAYIDSFDGLVFRAILKILNNRFGLQIYDELSKIYTREIKDACLAILDEEGNANRKNDITTNKVTRTVKGLGFKIERSKSGNKSSISRTSDMIEIFQINLGKFGSEDDKKNYADGGKM